MQSFLATLAIAIGFAGLIAMRQARRPFREWVRATGPGRTGAHAWRRLYTTAEADQTAEANRREARRWHACAVSLIAIALALSVASALI